MKRYFSRALLGTGEYLSRTENIVHTMGCLTALCCTDKKGILSWPNTAPERIFLVKKVPKKQHQSQPDDGDEEEDSLEAEVGSPGRGGADGGGKDEGYALVPEILSITHDPRNPFKVWNKFVIFYAEIILHSFSRLGGV
jgi:hypothetical protein